MLLEQFKLHATFSKYPIYRRHDVNSHSILTEIFVLHDHVTAFLHEQSKIFFYFVKEYSKDEYIALMYLKCTKKLSFTY